MKLQRKTLYIALAVLLCLIGSFGILKTRTAPHPITLNVSLFKYVPDPAFFEKAVEDCWKEKHPDVALNFVDWDCYSGEVPENLDVFVMDTIVLDGLAGRGYLLTLSEDDIQDYDDLIPAFVEGCRVNGELCAVPQLLCTDLLFTRKEDDALKSVNSIFELSDALDGNELILEKTDPIFLTATYLQALTDEEQQYMDHFPSIEAGTLSPKAVDSLEKIREMHLPVPEDTTEERGLYDFARIFADGLGRAYIGYSESMSAMGENAAEMDFRLFSMTDDPNIPLFYVDVAAVNAKISPEKKAPALDLLNLITGEDLLARASISADGPQYLFTSRYSVYDALAPEYPIYHDLKKIVSGPDAFVFRIKPDGKAFLEEAGQYAAMLPAFSE